MKKIFFIALILLSACNHGVKSPERLRNIPKQAFWVGGAEGGNWYYVDYIHPHRNGAHITIYNDRDGGVVISKKFMMVSVWDTTLKPVLINDLAKQIDAFNGKRILIKHVKGYMDSYMMPEN